MAPLEFDETLPTIRELTSILVKEAVKRSCGNLETAAKILGISRKNIVKYVSEEFTRI